MASATATSPSDTCGFAASHVRSRLACPRTASSVLPESTSGSSGGTVANSSDDVGASSTIRCTLVPLTPNDDTPARRVRSPRGHASPVLSSRTSPASQSTCGDGSSACSVGGSCSCWSAITILITPATPAAATVWPMLDFTEPSRSESPARSEP